MHESLTQRWLRQNTAVYDAPDTVYAHVDAALARFPTVRPKTDVYTYDDGRTQLLLCLHGLLPISYRTAAYNIPIALWITRDYPRQPPITYVVPTSDMLVRPSKHVDVSGRCELEYAANWHRKSEGCNLAMLLQTLQEYFSRQPPVYAKPPSSASPPQNAQPRRPDTIGPDYSARPPLPLPASQQLRQPLSQSALVSPTQNDDRPPLPLKPTVASSPTVPPRAPSAAQAPPLAASSSALASRPPPPLPPHPPESDLPQYRNYQGPPQYAAHEPVGAPPSVPPRPSSLAWSPGTPADPAHLSRYASPVPVSPEAYARPITLPTVPVNHVPRPPPIPTSPPRSAPSLSHPPPPPPPFMSPQGNAANYASSSPAPVLVAPGVATVFSSAPRPPPPDLLDAEDDAVSLVVPPAPAIAPPRPPNPELLRLHDHVHAKLTTEFASLSQAMALDAERLRAHQSDLLAGEPAIRDEMARLEAVRDVCRGVATRLRTVVDDTERNVADLKRRGDPDVDELVCSTSIVHNQLINLVAEDNAIEDTMYHLHRALNAGRIELERFLRTTRVLAEEQFMKRALIEKILAGLPMGVSAHPYSP